MCENEELCVWVSNTLCAILKNNEYEKKKNSGIRICSVQTKDIYVREWNILSMCERECLVFENDTYKQMLEVR